MVVRMIFAAFPVLMRLHRWFYFWRNELIFHLIFDVRRGFVQKYIRGMFVKHIQEVVQDQQIAHKLTPDYGIGCKRITPSDHYLQAFNLPHVHLISEKIDKLDETGIWTLDGSKSEVDVIIMATGMVLHVF